MSRDTWIPGENTAVAPPAEPAALPDRYERLALLGRGGMGEVWRVRDRSLDRTVALKVIHPDQGSTATGLARFRDEAQLTARLQHPGIVPVHDIGQLADGRWWYTMEEVQGRRLGEVLALLRAEGNLRRAVDLLLRACQAVAHAHARGVVHRDLKPDNVLVGDLGEVRVVDWGIAKVVADHGPAEPTSGEILGTRRFMSPEQAAGGPVGPAADVYALGVILGEVIAPDDVPLEALAIGLTPAYAPPPPELASLRDRATRAHPSERPADAAAFAAELAAWLEGARQRENGLAAVAAAVAGMARIPELRARAADRRAAALQAAVPAWEPVDRKRPVWALEDEATALEQEAARLEVESVQALQSAFTLAPELPEAHAALADWHRARHADAEAARDPSTAAVHEQLLRHHDRAGRHAGWLRGDGRLTLRCEPAVAELHRYVLRDRRLVPEPYATVDAPFTDLPLRMGSWLVVLRAGARELRYPVSIGRNEHWDGVAPGDTAPKPIALPDVAPDEVVLPPGPTWIGGDPEANNAYPWRRLWFDALVCKRFPVTNREYLRFLDALVAEGDEALALRCAPRERAARVEDEGALLYGRDADGRFVLQADADGDVWDPDWPVFHVDWWGAHAYADWLARTTGQPWRLPGDLELERMSRGVDGRAFPWGPHLDPTWCHMLDSHQGRPMPTVVDSHPVDESPWGVRGVGGNVRVWSLDLYRTELPEGRAGRPVDPGDDPGYRVTRGGDWYGPERLCRCANRGRDWPQVRVSILGFRVVRDGAQASPGPEVGGGGPDGSFGGSIAGGEDLDLDGDDALAGGEGGHGAIFPLDGGPRL